MIYARVRALGRTVLNRLKTDKTDCHGCGGLVVRLYLEYEGPY